MEPTEAAAYFALLGFASGNVMMFFLVSWLLNKEIGMGCKSHGECHGCRLDAAEDVANQLEVMYGPLWAVVNDIEPKLNIKHSQMKEYIDEQLRKIEARLEAHIQTRSVHFLDTQSRKE